MSQKILTIELLSGKYGVCRLDSSDLIPAWINGGDFYSITKTTDELSIVCEQNNIPNNIECEKCWKVLKIKGPLDFSLVGILSDLSAVLAQEGVSIFAISTFETDYVLVKDKDLTVAIEALTKKGYVVCC